MPRPVAQIGDLVQVSGTVSEFRPGRDPDNLTITQITSSNAKVTVVSSGNPLPAPTVLGVGGRMPPTENIDDDGAGNVETGGTFDPANDAIDFYESLEGMILQVDDAAVVGADPQLRRDHAPARLRRLGNGAADPARRDPPRRVHRREPGADHRRRRDPARPRPAAAPGEGDAGHERR